MNLERLNKTLTKYYEKPMKRYLFNERLCSKCAKEKWSDKGDVKVAAKPGICENCKKLKMVAYIDEEQAFNLGKEQNETN